MPDISAFRDYYKLIKPTDKQLKAFKDNYRSSSVGSPGLEVTFEASHSALYNPHKRFYLPAMMEDGVSSFVNGRKPAKILKHHNDEADPVGVIVGAEYVSTIPDFLKDNKDVALMADPGISINRRVAAADRFIQSGIPFQDGWEGLGLIKLKGIIKDAKTIQQIQDNLFDSVSTYFQSPDAVFCSTCVQNLVQDGWCEHEPGQKYEDSELGTESLCTLIPGIHQYKECSLVVFDADPLTTITIGMGDSVKSYSLPVSDWQNSSDTENANMLFEFKDDYKEDDMSKKANKTTLSDVQNEVLGIVKELRPDLEEDKIQDFAIKIAELQDEAGNYPDQEEAGVSKEIAIQYLLDDFETADDKLNADEIYAEYEKELDELNLADKKLSPEAREKLSKTVFCGPDRSFPVPDCAHVTAARKVIGRYKGPGNKTNILASVSQKAKALGYDTKDAEPKQDPVENEDVPIFSLPEGKDLDQLDNQDAQTLFAMSEALLIARDLKVQRDCSKCADTEGQLNTAKEDLIKAEDNLTEAETVVRILRTELKNQYAEYEIQADALIEKNAELYSVNMDKIVLMGQLTGKYTDIEKAKSELKNADLEAELAGITENFDLEKIVTKLNDGLTNAPKDTVDNPVLDDGETNDPVQYDNLDAPAQAATDRVKEYINKQQIGMAKVYYDRMVMLNVLDKEISFESFLPEEKTGK